MCMGCFLCKSVCRENTVVPEMCFDSKPFVKKILLLRLRRICLQLCFSRKCSGACAVFCVCKSVFREDTVVPASVSCSCKSVFQENAGVPAPFFVKPFFEKIVLCWYRFCCRSVFRDNIFVTIHFANQSFKKMMLCLRRISCKSVFQENTVVSAPVYLQPRQSRRYGCACAVFFANPFFLKKILSCLRRSFFFRKSVFREHTVVPAPVCVFRTVIRENTVVPEPFFVANMFFEKIRLCLRLFFVCKAVIRETAVVPFRAAFAPI